MTVADLSAVRTIRFEQHGRDGVLSVYAGEDPAGLPFAIARVFTLTGVAAGGARGNHAHRDCTQLLVALAGKARLSVDDGADTRRFDLHSPAEGVLVPPGLWIRVEFAGPDALVAVFCDRPFDEADYIRDREEFLAIRRRRV